MWRNKAEEQVFRAIEANDSERVAALCKAHPEAVSLTLPGNLRGTWIDYALGWGCKMDMVMALLDAGFDVNAMKPPGEDTALTRAIRHVDAEDLVRLLLDRGADPNLGRAGFIALTSCKDQAMRRRILQMLLDHGLEVNRLFTVFGDENKLFTVLDRAVDPQDVEFLRRNGGKYAVELVGQRAAYPGKV